MIRLEQALLRRDRLHVYVNLIESDVGRPLSNLTSLPATHNSMKMPVIPYVL